MEADIKTSSKEPTESRQCPFLAELKRFARHITAPRVQAFGTLVIAMVTVWTLFFTPIGDRIVAEINRSVEETQEELERHRVVNAKVTLRAVWAKLDDGLAENEYFARIAGDYNAHIQWRNSPDGKGLVPSWRWLQTPYRDGIGTSAIGDSFNEPGRWGNRLRMMRDLWPFDIANRRALDPLAAHQELCGLLDALLDEHFGGGGFGAPATIGGVIDTMKRDDAVAQLGGPAAVTVRGKLDDFLQQHSTLSTKSLRVQLARPYTATEVVETGQEVVRNLHEARNALREFVRIESSPFF